MNYWKKLVEFLIGPQGSGVRAKVDDRSTTELNKVYEDGKKPKAKKRGRGRPKGSKNKKK